MRSNPATNSSRSSARTGRTRTDVPSFSRTCSSTAHMYPKTGKMCAHVPCRVSSRQRDLQGEEHMADTETQLTGEELEKEIEKLADQETFEPPEEFKENALWNDPSIYDEADKDIPGWWAKHA